MSNSVTNAKLPNGGGQNRDDGQTTRSGSNQTASVRVSAGQGREIFSQVNVSLGANARNSDILNRKDKSANNNNSQGEKTDWQSIKQGTDSAKTAKERGAESSGTHKISHGKDAKPNNPDNQEPREQARNNNTEKTNNGQQATKSKDGDDDSAAKNRNQTAARDDDNRRVNPNNPARSETSNNDKNIENRNLKARDDGNSAKPNNETNRPNIELNHRNNGAQTESNRGQGAANASTNGMNRGQGHEKTEQGRGRSEQNNPNLPNNSQNTPNPLNSSVNALKNAVENTPLFNNRNQSTANDTPGRNAPPSTASQTRHPNLTINVSVVNNPENDSNSQGNHRDGFLGEVISQIFRENDVYLSKNAVKTLVEHHGADTFNRLSKPAFEVLPKEISQLVRTIENQIFPTLSQRQIDTGNVSNRFTIEMPPELDNQIQAAKNLFTQIFAVSDAKHFSRMNIQERMLAAIEIFLKNLPAEMPGNLQNNSAEKILAGFLLARGLIVSDARNSPESLLEMMQSATTDKSSLAAMRDFGGLVKVLISDAANSKSTANLETAVQKFARILVAINCLDTVLTAVKLASQNQFASGNVGRTLAIVQVYELINRLVLAGQSAMREAAAEIAQKNAAFKGEPDKSSRSVFPAKTVADLTETDLANEKNGDSKHIQAESALRKFLEFNPMLATDKFVSAFDNYDDARQAQNDFLNHHQIEIEQWLRGGNHRLVKDVDFEKPIGIVVERDKNDFVSATTARIVLVRDGSVQGWHFLKSFLVA